MLRIRLNMESADNPPLDETKFSNPDAVAFYGGINAANGQCHSHSSVRTRAKLSSPSLLSRVPILQGRVE